MALRPYAAAKRTLSFTDKLGEVNWGLMLLICMIGCAGIAMLYSVANAHFQPWALKQIGHFTLGLFVLLQPNLGTTLIIVADGCSLLFLAGLSWWWIAPTLAAIAAAIPLAWRFVLHDYQKSRVETFLNPESDALGKGWNITQAKIAIGSGGVGGKGFTQGTQSRLNFLPEKQTDFIWTSFCEEFGFVGALALLVLFGVIIFYGVQTAMSARSQFGRLVAMGVTLNFFFYIMINGLMLMG